MASTSALAGSAESGAQAAAPAKAAPVVPKGAAMPEHIELPETSPAGQTELSPQEVLEWIEYDVNVMERYYKRGYSDATTCRGFQEQLTEHVLEMDSLDLSGMDEMQEIRRALQKKMEDLIN